MPTFIDKNGETFTGDGYHKPKKNLHPVEITWPKGKGFSDMRYAVPGVEGETRVLYRVKGTENWKSTAWKTVNPSADFTAQIKLTDLAPKSAYEVKVQTRSSLGEPGQEQFGGFRTAPAADDATQQVVFAVSTGQAFHDQDRKDGFQIYPTMLETLKPDFFVHTGDIVYYDRMAKSLELAWWHWQRTYSRPTNVAFHNQVGSYFIKDDHDTWTNDSYPTMRSNMGTFSWDDGIRVFKEQVPMGEKTYRHVRWGKDLEIWFVEGRDFRSANPMPDGPEKTIWGAEQKKWFKETVQASDATFRVLISPTPIIGPDRGKKNDNHSNAGFTHEGDEIRAFLASQENMISICGDRHWQYHSIHPKTGVREYSCGPASDMHAGGWSQKDYREDFHRFLRVKGGYLSVTSERNASNQATLTMRFHGVDGKVHYEDVLVAE